MTKRKYSNFLFMDEDGNIDTSIKTKYTNPYDYDPILQWETKDGVESNGSVYTDRLLGWDYDKHNELCRKHFGNRGQYWNDREPEKIQAFMRDWTDNQELVLVRVEEHCNAATGYPVWHFAYYKPEA